ncbi:MAG: hypothetical protein QW560_03310 [Candidatus Nitrosocaldus sp.]
MGKGMDTNYKKSAYNSNNIIKIATILQKSLNNGKCNSMEMREVSRYITQCVRSNLEDCIKGLSEIIRSNSNGDRLGDVQSTLQRILHDVKGIAMAYEQIVAGNGSVDKAMLAELINIDNEITSNLKLLNNHISSIKDTGINENEIKELSFLAGEIELNIKERVKLIKKLELKGQL